MDNTQNSITQSKNTERNKAFETEYEERETINSQTSTCSSTSDMKWVLNETKQNEAPVKLMKSKKFLSWKSSAIWVSEIACRSKLKKSTC